jgi:asparagine synthase (glutamine-hydrolysing)
MGFGVPIGEWMRGGLRPWVEPDLAGPAATAGGLLRAEAVNRRWREHLSGRRNWQQSLWGALVLTHWQRRWMS